MRFSLMLWILMLLSNAFGQDAFHLPQKTDIRFIPNLGQFHPKVLYRAEIENGHLFVEKDRLTFHLKNSNDFHKIVEYWHHTSNSTGNLRLHSFSLIFSQSPKFVEHFGLGKVQEYYNFYLGSNSDKWASKVPGFLSVQLNNIFPGTNMLLYSVDGKLKYDIQAETPNLAKNFFFEVIGLKRFKLDAKGNLVFHTNAGIIKDSKPISFQNSNQYIKNIETNFVVTQRKVSFEFSAATEPDIPIIIDPTLIFSTYSGSKADNFGYTATYNSLGHLYAGGITDATTTGYPTTLGAYQKDAVGGFSRSPANLPCDITISKYQSNGSSLIYATYLGGSDSEFPHSLVASKDDELYIFGTSYSVDYPISKKAFQKSKSIGTDIIVSKLNHAGSKLLASTYVGGNDDDGLNSTADLRYNYADDFRGEITLDVNEEVWVASSTNSTNFPTQNPSQKDLKGFLDGCIFHLDTGLSQMRWGTYFGGKSNDALYSIELDKKQNVFVSGGTKSDSLDVDTIYQQKRGGDVDGIIAKFDKNNKLVASTYWGGQEYDQIYFLSIDSKDRVYFAGQTESSHRTTSGTYGSKDKGQIIGRISNDLKTQQFLSVFGNRNRKPDISPTAFLVDRCFNIYLSGWGSNTDPRSNPGSTIGLPITQDALQKTTDSNDFYLIALEPNASNIGFASFYGGDSTEDHVDGGTSRFDPQGIVYQSVCASCPNPPKSSKNQVSDFPTSSNAVYKKNSSPRCSNASFKIDFRLSKSVIADFKASPLAGCSPLKVDFTNYSENAISYKWIFTPQDTSKAKNPSFTFKTPGKYKVLLVARNALSCNKTDTFEREIKLYDHSKAKFVAKPKRCELLVEFIDSSENAASYFWDFGDGKTSTKKNPSHLYRFSGKYPVQLVVSSETDCVDTFESSIRVLFKDTLKADFSIQPPVSCLPVHYTLIDQSDGGMTFKWIVNNQLISDSTKAFFRVTDTIPKNVYLIVLDTNRCNEIDTATKVLRAFDEAVANFDVFSDPCTRKIQVVNGSKNADTYAYTLSDGSENDSSDFKYEFDTDGTKSIQLIINKGTTCADTITKTIDVEFKDSLSALFDVKPKRACQPVSLTIDNKSYNATSYLWDVDNGQTPTGFEPQMTLSQAGIYKVRLIVSNRNACITDDTFTQTIEVVQKPKAEFTYTAENCKFDIELTNNSENASNYLWLLPNDSTSREKEFTFSLNDTAKKMIQLIANPDSLCSDTAQLLVDLNPLYDNKLELYNVFTPNNDGDNDCFSLDGKIGGCKNIEWKIFNRWGEKVFESKSLKSCWNGYDKKQKKLYPEGVYFGIVKIFDDSLSLQHTISISITLLN